MGLDPKVADELKAWLKTNVGQEWFVLLVPTWTKPGEVDVDIQGNLPLDTALSILDVAADAMAQQLRELKVENPN